MDTLILPQIRLQKIIKTFLEWIREDFRINEEEDTYLFKLFGVGTTIGNYDYYHQGKHIFTQDVNELEGIDVKLFFDAKRSAIPTIHVTLPSENPGADGIGVDEGYQDSDYNDARGEYVPIMTRRYDTQYNLIITSQNPLEALLIYEVLRAGLISMQQSIQVSWGLSEMKLSGQDLTINQEQVPAHIFLRMLGVGISYEVKVPQLIPATIIRDIVFKEKIILDNGIN